jgi:hypothetical protein
MNILKDVIYGVIWFLSMLAWEIIETVATVAGLLAYFMVFRLLPFAIAIYVAMVLASQLVKGAI